MERVTIEVEEVPRAQAVSHPIVHQTHRPHVPVKPYATSYTMIEEIDIRVEEDIERIEVPKFDECRSSVIMHDFHMVSIPLYASTLENLDEAKMTKEPICRDLVNFPDFGFL